MRQGYAVVAWAEVVWLWHPSGLYGYAIHPSGLYSYGFRRGCIVMAWLHCGLYMRNGWCDFTLWVKERLSSRVHCRVVQVQFDDRPQDGKCVDTQK